MICDNIKFLMDDIESIKKKNGINYNIEVVCVSKTFSVDSIIEAYNCGMRHFGENRVLEAFDKFNSVELKNKSDLKLSIIGHLQRNKVKQALLISDFIQSIDKIETLIEIEKVAKKMNKSIDYLVEINSSYEEQKYGVLPEKLDILLEEIEKHNFANCKLRGFMTVGPLTDQHEKIREAFKLAKKLFDKYTTIFKDKNFDILSMGMSSDYRIAIEEGSNMVRIGSLIFGNRV